MISKNKILLMLKLVTWISAFVFAALIWNSSFNDKKIWLYFFGWMLINGAVFTIRYFMKRK